VETWHAKAEGKAAIDYGFHLAITDLRDQVMDEIPTLLAEGITSLKLFMAYKGVFQVDDTTLFRAMLKAADNGMLIMVHAENGDVIMEMKKKLLADGKIEPRYHAVAQPAMVEAEATGRAVALAGIAHAPLYVVHMTCEESLEQLALGSRQGFSGDGRNLHAVHVHLRERSGAPQLRGRQVHLLATGAPAQRRRRSLEVSGQPYFASGLHRSLSLSGSRVA
jgi:hypothetical protein